MSEALLKSKTQISIHTVTRLALNINLPHFWKETQIFWFFLTFIILFGSCYTPKHTYVTSNYTLIFTLKFLSYRIVVFDSLTERAEKRFWFENGFKTVSIICSFWTIKVLNTNPGLSTRSWNSIRPKGSSLALT